jgi:hypothetical protein
MVTKPKTARGGNVLTLLMLDGLVTRMKSRVRSFLVGTFTIWWRLFSSMISRSLMSSSVSGLPGITCGIRPVDVTQIKVSSYNNVGIGCMIYSTEG